MSEPEKIEKVLWHQSGVNRAGEPFVQLIMGEEVIAQMSVEQARDHGHAIIESAEAAEQDAFIVDWVKVHMGLGDAQAAGLLQDYRAWRMVRTGKRSGMEVIPTKAKP